MDSDLHRNVKQDAEIAYKVLKEKPTFDMV